MAVPSPRPRAGSHRAPRRPVRRRVGVATAAVAVVGVATVALGLPGAAGPTAAPAVADDSAASLLTASMSRLVSLDEAQPPVTRDPDDVALPSRSGSGRRIVFSESDQRVWLVRGDGSVQRTYLVSGSRFDNLDPGTYAVQSRSRHATAFDYSSTMEYFVRFTTGWSAPIGFHTVPEEPDGTLEQTKNELGTPLSAGCVRQWRDDAIALWGFAPVGTTVVVTA